MRAIPKPLLNEVVTLLCIKAAAIAVLFLFFFSPSHRPDISAQSVETHLLDAGAGAKEVRE